MNHIDHRHVPAYRAEAKKRYGVGQKYLSLKSLLWLDATSPISVIELKNDGGAVIGLTAQARNALPVSTERSSNLIKNSP